MNKTKDQANVITKEVPPTGGNLEERPIYVYIYIYITGLSYNIFYVPQIWKNLISANLIYKHGSKELFKSDKFEY